MVERGYVEGLRLGTEGLPQLVDGAQEGGCVKGECGAAAGVRGRGVGHGG